MIFRPTWDLPPRQAPSPPSSFLPPPLLSLPLSVRLMVWAEPACPVACLPALLCPCPPVGWVLGSPSREALCVALCGGLSGCAPDHAGIATGCVVLSLARATVGSSPAPHTRAGSTTRNPRPGYPTQPAWTRCLQGGHHGRWEVGLPGTCPGLRLWRGTWWRAGLARRGLARPGC